MRSDPVHLLGRFDPLRDGAYAELMGEFYDLPRYRGRDIIFGIRPEAITDVHGADRTSRRVVEAECHVEVVEPAGSDTFVVTRLGGREVIGRMRADADVRPGATLPFAFNMDKAVAFDPETQVRIR